MTKRKETSEERIAKLRQEPAFRELVAILKKQTEEQQDRFDEWCEDAERKERRMRRPRELRPESARAYSRALELQAKGQSWQETAEIVAAEGFLTEKGERFSANALRMACGRYKDKLAGQPIGSEDAEGSYHADHDEKPGVIAEDSSHVEDAEPSYQDDHAEDRPPSSQHAEHAEPPTSQEVSSHHAEGCEPPKVLAGAPLPSQHADHYELPPEMEAAVRRIAKEVAEEIVNTMLTIHTKPITGDLPPEPKTTGKSQDRKYARITLTIDKALWSLFEKERVRLGITSRGRMADILLWRALGKPKLSFEPDE